MTVERMEMHTENTELSIEITACVMTLAVEFNSCEFLYFHDFYTDSNDPRVQISAQISSIRPSNDKRDWCYRAALREFTLHKHSQTSMSSRLNTLERSATKKNNISPVKLSRPRNQNCNVLFSGFPWPWEPWNTVSLPPYKYSYFPNMQKAVCQMRRMLKFADFMILEAKISG